jgi:hypothetical protein
MPTIYTNGPTRVDVTQFGSSGGGGGGWLVLGALLLFFAAIGAGAKAAHAARHMLDEVLSVVLTVLAITGCIAGTAALMTAVVLGARALKRRQALAVQRDIRDVHVITDATPSHAKAIEAPRAKLTPEEAAELAARSAWADEQWVHDVISQRWAGIPRDWTEPEGSWRPEWPHWGDQQ